MGRAARRGDVHGDLQGVVPPPCRIERGVDRFEREPVGEQAEVVEFPVGEALQGRVERGQARLELRAVRGDDPATAFEQPGDVEG